ncbi:flagellin-like hook-associated protein FlgL [Bradyrhizobium sp. i1.3.1]
MASSLLTNSAAMTALQTLRSVSSQLATTQNRISTGQRVATASDNAAYWSIATSMRADNAALSAVSDSLGLSAATVDTEYTALTAVVGDKTGGLTKLQALLVEAKTAGIDRTKIQADITQIQQQMKGTADAATFNGVNWLSTTAATPATFNLVSSFSRVGRHADDRVHHPDDCQLLALYRDPDRYPGQGERPGVGQHDQHLRADRLDG